MFAFQFKLRRALPGWLFDWLNGIVGSAQDTRRVGVLVLKTPGMTDADALVVLRWSDWVDLHGPQKFREQGHRADVRQQHRARRQLQRGSVHG